MVLNFCEYKQKQDYKKSIIYKNLLEFYYNMAEREFEEITKNNKEINYYYKIIMENNNE